MPLVSWVVPRIDRTRVSTPGLTLCLGTESPNAHWSRPGDDVRAAIEQPRLQLSLDLIKEGETFPDSLGGDSTAASLTTDKITRHLKPALKVGTGNVVG